MDAIKDADIMVIVGCSLKVFPAAGMLEYLRESAILVTIDPERPSLPSRHLYAHVSLKATEGMKILEPGVVIRETLAP